MASPQVPGIDPNLVPVGLPQVDPVAAAIQALNPPTTVAADGEEVFVDPDEAAASGAGPLGPDATDASLGVLNDLLFQRGPGGPPKEPEAIVQESEAFEDPLMSPEAMVAHAEAGVAGAEQQYIAEQLKQGVQQQQQAAELEAMRGAQAEFERLGQTRDAELAQIKLTRDRMDVTSEEIARESENPAREGLFSGLGAGGAITRAIGLLFMSIGAGMRARGGDMSGAEQAIKTMRELQGQEVRLQQRRMALLGGKLNAQGTIIERHMANLQDAELAAKATEADLMRISLIKAKQYAVDAAPVIGAAESQLLVARIQQELLVSQAELNRVYGSKARHQIDTKYSIPRRMLQIQASRSPLAQPGAAPVAAAPVDPLEAHLQSLGNAPTPLDPAVADATGAVPPPAPAPAPASGPAPRPAPPPPPAATAQGQDWVSLLQSGDAHGAYRAMPEADRKAVRGFVERRSKTKEFEGQPNAALGAALNDHLRSVLPNRPQSSDEEERKLVTNGREYRLSVKGEEAQKVRSQIQAADRLVAKYQRLLKAAESYGGGTSWFTAVPDSKRGEITSLASQIASLSSQAFEMGVIQKWDNEMWNKMSGEKLAEWFTDPRTDFGAATRTAYQEALRDRKMRLDSYARPVGDRGAAPRERPVK